MRLTAAQEGMLAGRRGRALQSSMRILTAVARAYDADALIPAASAHVGLSLSSLGEAGVALLESWASEGARFAIPTTTNVLSFERGATAGAALQMRALDAVTRMGAIANCSCNPFSQGHLPKRGQSVAWSESATAPYLNAVLGARNNREGATALASALTGVTPRYGMHLDAQRRAGTLFRVEAPMAGLHSYHLLAAAVCRANPSGVPALIGLNTPPPEALLGFSAALATFSTMAMFHMVGITPEAPSLAALYPAGAPAEIRIGAAELEAELVRMRMCAPAEAKLVVIGCPHASLAQLREIGELLDGASLRPDCRLIVHTNRDVLAAAGGILGALRAGGVEISADTCVYVGLDHYSAGTALATDSAKMAFLMASRGLRTAVASTRECVESALGRPIRS
jgi:predicted aconitase